MGGWVGLCCALLVPGCCTEALRRTRKAREVGALAGGEKARGFDKIRLDQIVGNMRHVKENVHPFILRVSLAIAAAELAACDSEESPSPAHCMHF